MICPLFISIILGPTTLPHAHSASATLASLLVLDISKLCLKKSSPKYANNSLPNLLQILIKIMSFFSEIFPDFSVKIFSHPYTPFASSLFYFSCSIYQLLIYYIYFASLFIDCLSPTISASLGRGFLSFLKTLYL